MHSGPFTLACRPSSIWLMLYSAIHRYVNDDYADRAILRHHVERRTAKGIGKCHDVVRRAPSRFISS